ncbi:glutamine synthetase family protein [Nocardia sp. alder85J]|uniref:glutamine synthetase family protein n=1 Tax=Nocardia sp. alder85J TaxID=2862949 RepID=UPI00224E5A1E|nr:glutamine synthetase family protein [Nocardia sp. alder85J]MCX4098836.1 glutamine synthetase family protein [Nocardia sp. alder85J]
MFLSDDSIVAGRYAGGPVGDLRLHPDPDRVVVSAAMPGWAWAPGDRYDQEGGVHPRDSRLLLRRVVDELAGGGWSVRAGFEVEWMVGWQTGDDRFVPVTTAPAYGMARVSGLADYLRDVMVALGDSGVAVDQVHPEYSAGQFEVSFAAADPVGAADTLVLVRETVRAVGVAHDMRVSFAPKVVPEAVGNGGHVHLSLWRDGVNVMSGGDGPCGPTGDGEHFAGGILARLPALMAVGCASVASYLRLLPSQWAGVFACWGRENREAALRYVSGCAGERERAANIEVKCFDATANPYLLLAGLLAAGAAGLADSVRLPAPVDVDPGALTPEQRAAAGIHALPATLADAITIFEADPVLGKAFGDSLVDTVATVRRGEIAALAGCTPDEVIARTRWRY